jgi:dihydroorotase-like cyclic amidohydrolase
METALPALFTLMNRGQLTLERVVEVFHLRPRKILARGEFQSATGWLFVDPKKEYEVTREELPGISQNSCFLGAQLQGRIEIRAERAAIYRR